MQNVFRPDFEPPEDDPPGYRVQRDRLGGKAGGRRLGASLYRLPPGEAVCPYHWHAAEEEMLIVIAGRPSVRSPAGWRELAPGDVVAFGAGEDGSHQVANASAEAADVLLVSQNDPLIEVCGYPDSGKIGVYRPAGEALFREDSGVGYYDGEGPATIPPA